MIKLQDFAIQNKVTDRAIQKHLKNHEKELEGHFERKGPNGTWLDEYACNYIKDLMRIQTVTVIENTLEERVKELELELAQAKGTATTLKNLYDEERAKNLELSQDQILLEVKEQEVSELKTKLQEVNSKYENEKEAADQLHRENAELKMLLENEKKKTWFEKLFGR